VNILTYNILQKPIVGWLIKDILKNSDYLYSIDYKDKFEYYSDFSNVDLHDQVYFKYGYNYKLKKSKPQIILGFIKYFRNKEYLFYSILSRYDFNSRSFTYDQRVTHLRTLISECISIINRFKKLDLLIFYDYPHHADSFVLYHLAKFLNIKIKIISYLYIMKDYRIVIDKTYENRFEEYLVEKSNKYEGYFPKREILDKITNYKNAAEHIKPEYITYKKIFSFVDSNSIFYLLLKDFYRSFRRGIFSRSNYVIKYSNKKIFHNLIPPIEIFSVFLVFLGRMKIKELKRNYNKICQKPDLNENYIFFCPNVQPEASTLPLAENFVDYRNILDLLIKFKPTNYKIFYKEHPLTFNLQKEAYLCKHTNFYLDLENKGIIFIKSNYDVYKLIKHSKFVLTATGSVGPEALIRGKLVLNFGISWWRNFKNVTNIQKESDLKEFFKLLEAGDTKFSPSNIESDILKTYKKSISFPFFYEENLSRFLKNDFINSSVALELKKEFSRKLLS